MARPTIIRTAVGLLLSATLIAAIAVSVGIMSDPTSAEGPGTFQPTAALLVSTTTASTASTVESTSPTTVAPAADSDDEGSPHESLTSGTQGSDVTLAPRVNQSLETRDGPESHETRDRHESHETRDGPESHDGHEKPEGHDADD